MNQEQLQELLEQVQSRDLDIPTAITRFKKLPFENVGSFAKIDHHRAIRQGMAEVIFGQGKEPEHLAEIFLRLQENSPNVLATRVGKEAAELVLQRLPDVEYHPLSRTLRWWSDRKIKGKGKIAVICAGTADLPVAEEARITAEIMGNEVDAIADVGVAGIHRLFAYLDVIQSARVCVVCAGMEAALPSAVGGLVSCPVIGVPTSVGYGAHFHGLASLLSMLNSCASNVSTVNIDNGFGGAYVASLINRL